MTVKTTISERSLIDDRDFERMYDLAVVARNDAIHVIDLPWRMSSPSARMPERVRLWENDQGELVAWAVLQFPAWHCLDYVVHPAVRTAEFEAEVLGWACSALQAEAVKRTKRLPCYVCSRDNDGDRIVAIERAGFSRQDWGYVHLVRRLEGPIPEPDIPAGFVVRSLAGADEVAAYVDTHRAAFSTTNMSVDWRQATLRDPHYEPELDLVAIAPDGALAGFCVCWITPEIDGRRLAQIEPLGILPEYQRRGLGRALLFEALCRAKSLGADQIEVNAESFNAASQGTYTTVGFRPVYEMPFFLRGFE